LIGAGAGSVGTEPEAVQNAGDGVETAHGIGTRLRKSALSDLRLLVLLFVVVLVVSTIRSQRYGLIGGG
jgi:hypothetical protein